MQHGRLVRGRRRDVHPDQAGGLPRLATTAHRSHHRRLELPERGLVAVGSHEPDLIRDGGQVVTSTYLECAAVRTDLQGAVLSELEPLDDDGRPVTLGRYLLEVLLSDISERPRGPIVRAVVARENARSLRLRARIGLTDERDDVDERFVQRIGCMAS